VVFIQCHPYVQKVRSKSESRELVSLCSVPVSSSFFNSRSPCRFERCDDNTREIRPRFANFVFATSNARFHSLTLTLILSSSSSPSPIAARSRRVFLYADCRQLLAIVRRKARETELRRVRTSGSSQWLPPATCCTRTATRGANERERKRKRGIEPKEESNGD